MRATASFALILVLGAACFSVAAGPDTVPAGTPPALPDRHPGHDVIWSQLPADGVEAWFSEFAPNEPFYAECAVDFIAPEDTEITHIHWWGVWKVPESPPPIRVTRLTRSGSGRPELDCSNAELRGCDIVIYDTNVGAPSNADLYGGVWEETGPEVVYMLQIPFPHTSMVAGLSNMTADLDIFLLPDCDETVFLHAEDETLRYTFAEPGIYYLVVEGYDGAESNYTLTIECPDTPDNYFTIRFYDDLPIGRDRSVPGAMLYEYHTIHDHQDGEWPSFSQWADIPRFPVVKDERYWVSVQRVQAFSPHGAQWYWSVADTLIDNDSVTEYALVGLPRWTALGDVPESPGPTDLAFELADIETAVEARSWGLIKSLYR